ncbi:(2Fe-2S)-binding protein [Tsuneonella sp. SYSU-LHT278]|uniref:(2Fe-2S)-binding protein n=1 Tax=Tsuneonella sediminis TaxID=3416089 RepID=UPI003F79EF0F
MYVCVCNAIRECELRRAALRAGGDAEAVYAALGKRPNCGTCLADADAIVFEEREMAAVPFAA